MQDYEGKAIKCLENAAKSEYHEATNVHTLTAIAYALLDIAQSLKECNKSPRYLTDPDDWHLLKGSSVLNEKQGDTPNANK